MDLIDEIRGLASRIPSNLEYVKTEEATKTAFVIPFVRALGFNTEDPREVEPEFAADVGIKKGEKVDYAILMDGKPVMLIECKAAGSNLDEQNAAQLFRYFAVTPARFGILTNGVVYRFYSDLDEPNKMDLKPFLELNMLELDNTLVEELKRFTKSSFDLQSILAVATELKYTREIKRILSLQLKDPTEDFVRMVASHKTSGQMLYSGRMTQAVMERFAQFTRSAFNQFINDRVDLVLDRAKSARVTEIESAPVDPAAAVEMPIPEEDPSQDGDDGIVTTEEERQGFYIVRALLHDVVDVKRIEMRDMRSYCGVLLDHSNRKPICRLWFNRSQKFLGLIDQQKQEERVAIEDIDDIFQYADRLKATVRYYDQPESQQTSP